MGIVQMNGFTRVVDCMSQAHNQTYRLVLLSGTKLDQALEVGSGRWRGHLVVACAEPPAHILVIKNLNLKAEVLLQVLDQHDEEGQLDAERFAGVTGATDKGCADVGAHHLQNGRADVLIRNPLDVAIAHCNAKAQCISCWLA